MTRIEIVRPQRHVKNNGAPFAYKQKQEPVISDRLDLTRPTSRPVHFQGKRPQTDSTGQTGRKTCSPKPPQIIHKLFGQPRKNMMWTLGYSLGGVMLLPIPPVATGAFCLALVHFVSATYQFLQQKPDLPISPANSSSN